MLASTSASLNLNVMMQELLLQHAGFIYYASAALHLSSYFDCIKRREEYITERKMIKQQSAPIWIE